MDMFQSIKAISMGLEEKIEEIKDGVDYRTECEDGSNIVMYRNGSFFEKFLDKHVHSVSIRRLTSEQAQDLIQYKLTKKRG